MTGHGEIQGQVSSQLEAMTFPQSFVYRRKTMTANEHVRIISANGSGPISEEEPHLRPGNSQETIHPCLLARGPLGLEVKTQSALDHNSFWKAPQNQVPAQSGSVELQHHNLDLARDPNEQPDSTTEFELVLKAWAYANLGDYAKATACCERILRDSPFASEPYVLLASIAQEQKSYDVAKSLLKKAVYLAPTSPTAYLDLGAQYHSEGDRVRARTMFVTALELLLRMPAEAQIGSTGGQPAHEWISYLSKLLSHAE